MKLSHAFEVPASPAATLRLLLGAERVVECMPGTQLLETVDERTWKAKMTVKLGPVAMDFANDVRLVEIDEAGGLVRMEASGRETHGKGGARADITCVLTASGAGTRVEMATDLRFSGQAAQFGRPSVVQDVSSRLVERFADCLGAQLSADSGEAQAARERAEKPLRAFSLFVAVLVEALRRALRRGGHQARGRSA